MRGQQETVEEQKISGPAGPVVLDGAQAARGAWRDHVRAGRHGRRRGFADRGGGAARHPRGRLARLAAGPRERKRAALCFAALACVGAPGCLGGPWALTGPLRARVEQQLAAGQWADAIGACKAVLRRSPDDCGARYCELIGRTMIFVDQLNRYILPRYRTARDVSPMDLYRIGQVRRQLARATEAADEATARSCQIDLPRVPLRIGESGDPIIEGEVRGLWTPRDAHLIGAILYSFRYLLDTLSGRAPVRPPKAGHTMPALPDLLEKMAQHLTAHDRLLLTQPADPAAGRGGWHDRDGDGEPSAGDVLLIDIFRSGRRGSSERVFDFSEAEFVRGESLPRGALVPTSALPRAQCGYQRWHIDTLFSGRDVGFTDGMSFSPDGRRLALPLQRDGRYQVHVLNADGTGQRCLTCGAPGSSDGVRWQPGGDWLIFISDRDHPFALGNAGGGAGQELYAMRSDGSQVTRLTRSPAWATNYHANWSMDGRRIVWGTTDRRTWDVVVADFVVGPAGPHLASQRRLTRDTTWWETHGFSADGKAVITSNTRAGLLASDIYAIDIASGRRTRLTDDPAWDEHAHLSPDGRKLAWISGRWQPAGIHQLSAARLAPLFDFFWIVPGVMFEFINHPAGQATELTLMDADGEHVQRLTSDGEIVADNQWSPDGRRIVFRQMEPRLFGPGRIRVLTFDDCEPPRP